jgi:hypothetical protein
MEGRTLSSPLEGTGCWGHNGEQIKQKDNDKELEKEKEKENV